MLSGDLFVQIVFVLLLCTRLITKNLTNCALKKLAFIISLLILIRKKRPYKWRDYNV